jgi:hypothetical protein
VLLCTCLRAWQLVTQLVKSFGESGLSKPEEKRDRPSMSPVFCISACMSGDFSSFCMSFKLMLSKSLEMVNHVDWICAAGHTRCQDAAGRLRYWAWGAMTWGHPSGEEESKDEIDRTSIVR